MAAHGRTWAYAGMVFGGAGSVAANVYHALVPPDPRPEGWAPQPGAIAWGVAVAVALLISVEVLARIDWPDTWGWRAVRVAGGGIVALVAGTTSYLHLADLLRVWHEPTVIQVAGPAIVDGLMVLCSFALMAPARAAVLEQAPATSSSSAPPVESFEQATPAPAAQATPKPRVKPEPASAGSVDDMLWHRGVKAVEAIWERGETVSRDRLAAELAIGKTPASRLLQTLRARGVVDERGRKAAAA